jgi:hypothetical protein
MGGLGVRPGSKARRHRLQRSLWRRRSHHGWMRCRSRDGAGVAPAATQIEHQPLKLGLAMSQKGRSAGLEATYSARRLSRMESSARASKSSST